jgi:hypothetical protein
MPLDRVYDPGHAVVNGQLRTCTAELGLNPARVWRASTPPPPGASRCAASPSPGGGSRSPRADAARRALAGTGPDYPGSAAALPRPGRSRTGRPPDRPGDQVSGCGRILGTHRLAADFDGPEAIFGADYEPRGYADYEPRGYADYEPRG